MPSHQANLFLGPGRPSSYRNGPCEQDENELCSLLGLKGELGAVAAVVLHFSAVGL